MLIETNKTTGFRVGDAVKTRDARVGVVEGFEAGKIVVRFKDGGTDLFESQSLERRQILMG